MTPEHLRKRLRERLSADVDRVAALLDHEAPMLSPGWRSDEPVVWRDLAGEQWRIGSIAPLPADERRPARVGECIAEIRASLDTMADAEALRIEAAATLVQPARYGVAVIERVANRWPWWRVLAGGSSAAALGFDLFARLSVMAFVVGRDISDAAKRVAIVNDAWRSIDPWPHDVAVADARAWVISALNAKGAGSGDAYAARCAAADADLGTGWNGLEHLTIDGAFLYGNQLAWFYSAVHAFEEDRRQSLIKLPSSRVATTAVAMIATPPRHEDPRQWGADVQILPAGSVMLRFAGRKVPMQLKLLSDSGDSLTDAVARALLDGLGDDGLRDYLTLHCITTSQGASGDFRWAWREHRELAGYDRRVGNKNVSDAEMAKRARQNLWWMKRAEIWAEASADGKRDARRVGPFGIIDIDRELITEADGAPLVIGGKHNPALYLGAKRGTEKPHFTLVQAEALTLPSDVLRVVTLAAFSLRASDNGRSSFKARTLWEYAGIAPERRAARKKWPGVRHTTERILERAHVTLGQQWSGGGDGPDAVYVLEASPIVRDRIYHGVSPALPAAPIAVPRTGDELRAALTARGLTMSAIAVALGVNVSSVTRAIQRGRGPLPPQWLARLAEAGLRGPT